MRKLVRYLKDYKLESVLGPLFKMLEASFELFVPLVMAQIIDVGIKNQDASYILKMGGLLVLLGMFSDGSVFCCKGVSRIQYGSAQ